MNQESFRGNFWDKMVLCNLFRGLYGIEFWSLCDFSVGKYLMVGYWLLLLFVYFNLWEFRIVEILIVRIGNIRELGVLKNMKICWD